MGLRHQAEMFELAPSGREGAIKGFGHGYDVIKLAFSHEE